MAVQLTPVSWQHVGLLLQVYSCRLHQFADVICTMNCVQGCLYTGSPFRQTIDGCVCNGLMSTEPGKLIGTKLFFKMVYALICVRRSAGERCLPDCAIKRHSGLIPGVMVWGVISCHGRSNLLRIEGNLNNNRYVREALQPEALPFL
ncbi:uncharacterized protein TNCV_1103391 [Trichonephila clavipes]|nr:uncharacterized protein TNCV_1103391 [Trichonephila clavipes]